MEKVKELSIKNRTYYLFNDMINIKNFHSNLSRIDKKPYKDFDIYYLGYITIKKIGNYENIHSVNLLYLIIHSAAGYFKKKYGEKYLILDSSEKYEEVFSGIRSEIQTINSVEELFYGEYYVKILINTEDNVPINKKLKFPSLTIIIRCIFQNAKKLYPQIYLDKCLQEL